MKKFCLIIFLLLPISGLTQISNRLDSLRLEVYYYCNVATATSWLTASKANRAINHAIVETCKTFPALAKLDTIVIPKTVEGQVLNTDFDRGIQVFKMIGDSIRIPLKYSTAPDSLRDKYTTVKQNVHNPSDTLSPVEWWTEGQRLFMHPKYLLSASEADTFIVHYYAIDQKLSVDSNTISIVQAYRLPLCYFAAAELWRLRGRSDKADEYMTLFANYQPIVVGRQEVNVE